MSGTFLDSFSEIAIDTFSWILIRFGFNVGENGYKQKHTCKKVTQDETRSRNNLPRSFFKTNNPRTANRTKALETLHWCLPARWRILGAVWTPKLEMLILSRACFQVTFWINSWVKISTLGDSNSRFSHGRDCENQLLQKPFSSISGSSVIVFWRLSE